MSKWIAERGLVAFDLETTGVSPEDDRIVTAAVIEIPPAGLDRKVREFSWLVDPGVEIPDGAAAVHGVTTEHARENGEEPQSAVLQIVKTLGTLCNDGAPVVAMNARFDLTMLDREARRYGVAPFEPTAVVDPMVIDRYLDQWRRGKRTLTDLCTHYRVSLTDAHEAGADALAAARLAYRIITEAEVKKGRYGVDQAKAQAWAHARLHPENLHDAQVEWAANQAADLAAYFARVGKTEAAESVRGDWPIVPWGVPA